MFLSLIILLAAIVGGTLLSYLYAERMALSARLCAGTCTGLAMLAVFGFVLASFLGMSLVVPLVSALILTLPLLMLLRGSIRSRVQGDMRAALARLTKGPHGVFAFFVVLIVLLGIIFSHAMFSRYDGIYTGFVNSIGDLPFHIQIISSFAYGQNFPPQDPAFAGVRFAYPFMADFLTSMLVTSGASIETAMLLQNLLLAVSMVGLLWYWTWQLTGDRLAANLAPVFVLLSGGLGWWRLFDDIQASNDVFSLFQHLPHDYSIIPETIFRWGNSLTTLFVPQRSILFGIPLAVFIFAQWWLAVVQPNDVEGREPLPAQNSSSKTAAPQSAGIEVAAPTDPSDSFAFRRMLMAGVIAGLLPLIHAHSYLVVMGIAACLSLLFWRWKFWVAFFVPALVIGGIEGLWSTHGAGIRGESFLGWQFGWDRNGADPILFWLMNTGLVIPLLLLAIFSRKNGKPLVQSRLLCFYAPFLLCFLVPNVLKMAPWIWDNIKVLFYWYVASVPLIGLLLARWFRDKVRWKLLAAGCVIALTLAGYLDLFRIVTGNAVYREYDNDGIVLADLARDRTEPHAVMMSGPSYNPVVYLTGRPSLLGYPGTIWSRGLDAGSRREDIEAIYAGAPEAMRLLQEYKVDYAFVTPLERLEIKVNDAFWNQFPVVAYSGEYRLYKVGPAR